MKTTIQIKSIFGKLLFEFEKENNSVKDTLVEAVKNKAHLQGADLREADLQGAYLQGADLRGAYLQGADLQGAYLQGADLQGAYLREADLRGADLRGADLNVEKIKHLFQIIPEEGSFIGWKKLENNCIAKLEIPANAKRHNHLSSRKCRAEFVNVLEIKDAKSQKIKKAWNFSYSSAKTLYEVGKTIHPDEYDSDPRIDCSNGIHFFLTRQEAKEF
jgi:hypothetical protein